MRFDDWDYLLRLTSGSGALGVPCLLSRYRAHNDPDRMTLRPAGPELFAMVDRAAHGEELEIAPPPIEPDDERLRLRALKSPVPGTEPRPFTVVIPSFEVADHLRACLRSVFAYTPQRAEWNVVIVDNGSGPEVAALLDEVEANERVTVLRFDEILGFTAAVNIGLAEAGPGRDVVLLNNDAVVTPG